MGQALPDIPEEAVMAAALAIFDGSIPPDWDAGRKAHQWLLDALSYRERACIVLAAALPYFTNENDVMVRGGAKRRAPARGAPA